MAQSRVYREVLRAYAYVVLWMGVSSSVILFNKWLLAFSGFPYPIALTAWHMAFCSTVGILCVRGLNVVKSHNMSSHDYLRRVMPIGACRTTFPLRALGPSTKYVTLHCRCSTPCLLNCLELAPTSRAGVPA